MATNGLTTAGFYVSDLPTADEDPKAWNTIYIAGLECPGVCLPLDGERMRDVNHDKAKGSSRDLLKDNGLSPTECTVRIRTTSGPQFRQLYDFYLKYMDPDRVLSRLNIVPVAHPQLYARGIKQGYFFSAPLPKPTHDSGIYPYISEFRFKIVGPKTQISSAGTSSKPKPVPGEKRNILGGNFYTAPVNAVTAITLFGRLDASVKAGPPAPKDLTLYEPEELQQLAGKGDKTAQFMLDLQDNAAPYSAIVPVYR